MEKKQKPCINHKQAYPTLNMPEVRNINGLNLCHKCGWGYK